MAIYGLQFHLEVDQTMMVRWLKVPENQEEIARLPGDVNPDHIIGQQRGISETARTQRLDVLRIHRTSRFGEIRCGLTSCTFRPGDSALFGG
jgi:GMP synthase-like glutamine amidotransferase